MANLQHMRQKHYGLVRRCVAVMGNSSRAARRGADERTERADASMFNRLCGLARDMALDSQLFDVQPGFRAHALWLNCCIRETGIPEEGLFCLASLSPNGRFHSAEQD